MTRARNDRFGVTDIIVPNPISPVTTPAWLYVPRVPLVIPIGGYVPPPTQVSYRILENGVDIRATEQGDLRITEQYILP